MISNKVNETAMSRKTICRQDDLLMKLYIFNVTHNATNQPNSGYGYIEQGKEIFQGEGIYELKSFREKPDLKTAISYLEQGGFTWNSGMFMWSADVIVGEIRKHNPEISAIMDEIEPALFTEKEQELVNELFPKCPKISIDYAVMEKTNKACVMPAEYGWSDLGTWGSLRKYPTPF